jgi:hypothetical protein
VATPATHRIRSISSGNFDADDTLTDFDIFSEQVSIPLRIETSKRQPGKDLLGNLVFMMGKISRYRRRDIDRSPSS